MQVMTGIEVNTQ